MDSDLAAVKRVVEAFERSDWQEIDVRWGDQRIHLAATTPVAVASDRAGPAIEPESGVDEPVSDAAAPIDAGPLPVPQGAHVVKSPSPGIFWRSPEPGAPPFTDIGQAVGPAATLCIIEVMKLMNHVKAGVAGQVVAIYVENGAAVAKDEPLFAVADAGAAAEGSIG